MRCKSILLFICIGFCLLTVGCDKNANLSDLQIEQLPYHEDVEPICERFDYLYSVEKVYWKSEQIGDGVIGPSSYWLKGFICITEEEKDEIISAFAFEEDSPEFPEGISPEITGYKDFTWKTSSDFSRELLKGNFVGEVYLDALNGVIYLDVEKA